MKDCVKQWFSNVKVDLNHLGILLKCTFGAGGLRWVPDPGSNPCLLHWQAGSLTTRSIWEGVVYKRGVGLGRKMGLNKIFSYILSPCPFYLPEVWENSRSLPGCPLGWETQKETWKPGFAPDPLGEGG